uniref:DUF4808 domain-containing protein n=1 Tax=Strongyloides papillosus TaxID=174720 RepID=A0A0N5BVE9_STREA
MEESMDYDTLSSTDSEDDIAYPIDVVNSVDDYYPVDNVDPVNVVESVDSHSNNDKSAARLKTTKMITDGVTNGKTAYAVNSEIVRNVCEQMNWEIGRDVRMRKYLTMPKVDPVTFELPGQLRFGNPVDDNGDFEPSHFNNYYNFPFAFTPLAADSLGGGRGGRPEGSFTDEFLTEFLVEIISISIFLILALIYQRFSSTRAPTNVPTTGIPGTAQAQESLTTNNGDADVIPPESP